MGQEQSIPSHVGGSLTKKTGSLPTEANIPEATYSTSSDCTVNMPPDDASETLASNAIESSQQSYECTDTMATVEQTKESAEVHPEREESMSGPEKESVTMIETKSLGGVGDADALQSGDQTTELIRSAAARFSSTEQHRQLLQVLTANPQGLTTAQILKQVSSLAHCLREVEKDVGVEFLSLKLFLAQCEGVHCSGIRSDGRILFFRDSIPTNCDRSKVCQTQEALRAHNLKSDRLVTCLTRRYCEQIIHEHTRL